MKRFFLEVRCWIVAIIDTLDSSYDKLENGLDLTSSYCTHRITGRYINGNWYIDKDKIDVLQAKCEQMNEKYEKGILRKGMIFDLYQDGEPTKRVMALNKTDVIDLNTFETIKDVDCNHEIGEILIDDIFN